jgi:hypothetical protein
MATGRLTAVMKVDVHDDRLARNLQRHVDQRAHGELRRLRDVEDGAHVSEDVGRIAACHKNRL